MPTPLGHALGGVAAGLAIASPGTDRAAAWRYAASFAALGMLPDLDLLLPAHRGPTHSIGAALIVGLAAAALTRRGRLAAAAACAYGTHVLLDWLGADTSVPEGIMALWPLTREHYQASIAVFDSAWRRNETPDFWIHNIKAVVKELAILGPLAWLAAWSHARRLRSRVVARRRG